MQIEPIDATTVKVTLTAQDMALHQITYDTLDYHDPATRLAIRCVLEQVELETKLNLSQSKLFIETFPTEEEGCLLYINLVSDLLPTAIVKPKSSFDTPLVFQLDSLDSLIAVCRRLLHEYAHLIIESAIYTTEHNAYILLIYSYCRSNERIINLVIEYGDYLAKGAIVAAHYKEHGKEILAENAIEQLVTYLG